MMSHVGQYDRSRMRCLSVPLPHRHGTGRESDANREGDELNLAVALVWPTGELARHLRSWKSAQVRKNPQAREKSLEF